MTHSTHRSWFNALAACALQVACFHSLTNAQQLEPEASSTEDIEVLTRGPLHEAFAEQTSQDPAPGITAPRKPPETIEEVPPEVKPEGNNVQWIPGYWHWDDERQDFIWVSGIWRQVPAGMNWVPGYWAEVDGKYNWVSGLWTAGDSESLDYQPLPPPSLEAGPSSLAPADDYFWIPGCWSYRTGGYSWRTGYWTRSRTNLVWIPSYYSWTPRGCIYVDGYWDYPFHNRGVLFCPVYFRDYASQHHIHYSPHVTLSSSRIFFHLFVRSGCNSYHFGDYYGHRHGQHQYHPWFDYHRVGRQYDPFHAHFEARHRHSGRDYTGRYRDWHHYFAGSADRCPPRTFAAQHGFEKRHKHSPHLANASLARGLREVTADVNSKQRFVHLNDQHHRDLSRRIEKVQQLGARRTKVEAELKPKTAATNLSKLKRQTAQQIRSAKPFSKKLPPSRATQANSSEPNRQQALRSRSELSNRDGKEYSNAARLRVESPQRTTTTKPTTRPHLSESTRQKALRSRSELSNRDGKERSNAARLRVESLQRTTTTGPTTRANDDRPKVATEATRRDVRTPRASAVPPRSSSADSAARSRGTVGSDRSPKSGLRSRATNEPRTNPKPPTARSSANRSSVTTARPNSTRMRSSSTKPTVKPPAQSARVSPRTDSRPTYTAPRQSRTAPRSSSAPRSSTAPRSSQTTSRAKPITSSRSSATRSQPARPFARGGRSRPNRD